MSAAARERHGIAVHTLHVRGDVDARAAPRVFMDLERLARRHDVAGVVIDFTEAGDFDSAGVAVLTLGRRTLERAGKTIELRGLSSAHEAALALGAAASKRGPIEIPPRYGPLELVGVHARAWWDDARAFVTISVETARTTARCLLGREKLPTFSTLEQAVLIGVDALPIVGLLSLLLGLILAFQSVYGLADFGAEVYTAEVVSLGMTREFGAFITAMILSGRTGAAIAAELGTMSVDEEIDALRTMGVPPVRLLVVPRFLAITVVMPALTMFAIAVAVAGALLIAPMLDMSAGSFYRRVIEPLEYADFALGLGKSVLFGWVIALVGCHVGLRTRGGATSVGRSATRAVVTSIFLVVVIDGIVTTFWTLARGPV